MGLGPLGAPVFQISSCSHFGQIPSACEYRTQYTCKDLRKTVRPLILSMVLHSYISFKYKLTLGALYGPLKVDSHIACRAHAVPLPCRAAKGLECVFPI